MRIAPWLLVWPVYMWKLISHPEMLAKFGSDCLHWIPKNLHPFWRRSLCAELPSFYTLQAFNLYTESISVVVDVTTRKGLWLGVLDRNLLGEIKQECDEYLIPNVLCPWGCASYLHDGGCVSYDTIVSRFFPFVALQENFHQVRESQC